MTSSIGFDTIKLYINKGDGLELLNYDEFPVPYTHLRHKSGANPGLLERGFICLKVWGLALLILTHIS